MSYDRPNRIPYYFAHDFGDADQTYSIIGPKGKKGRLWDYGVHGVTEVFNGSSVTPKISIGSTSDADAYGDEIDLNALADNHSTSARSLYKEEAAGFAALMIERNIAADAEVVVHIVAATGSPTGQGIAFAIIDWDH